MTKRYGKIIGRIRERESAAMQRASRWMSPPRRTDGPHAFYPTIGAPIEWVGNDVIVTHSPAPSPPREVLWPKDSGIEFYQPPERARPEDSSDMIRREDMEFEARAVALRPKFTPWWRIPLRWLSSTN